MRFERKCLALPTWERSAQPRPPAPTPAHYIGEAKQSVATVEDVLKPLQRRGYVKYRVMKYAFVAGLFALMLARAVVPIRGILHAWTTH